MRSPPRWLTREVTKWGHPRVPPSATGLRRSCSPSCCLTRPNTFSRGGGSRLCVEKECRR
ncbi:hypothetical protein T484DRAFT_1941389 [Baffinella frigidus]|nr:hypothetical protein T484DRAFT_1941389 [Cryptophyta sp. CCMP2293]